MNDRQPTGNKIAILGADGPASAKVTAELGPVPGGLRRGVHVRCGAAGIIAELELAAVPHGPAHLAGLAGRRRLPQHPVGAQPAQDLHGQIPQQPGQPGRLVAGSPQLVAYTVS